MPAPTPNLISVTTIAKDGSRKMLHPADVRGRFTSLKRITALFLIGIYVMLPWIPVNGHPAVFLDVANRRFHLMGITFAAQDLWLGFFVVTGVAFSLFYITAFFGRIWCGWTCPYTVFLEHVFRRIERWIDGDAVARRKMDAAPWSVSKASKRILKHGIFILLSAVIAHVFLSYFVSLSQLYTWMQGSPTQHLTAFGIVAFLTGSLYFCFSWFREQFCIILCPYGRLQSALTDDHTIVIGYDKKRGEPRGRKIEGLGGDCVACNRCVQVCPTGIDIRNGLQLECIGCAACVDACDDVMLRIKRPTGLVRYDSLTGLEGGRTRLIRPRTMVYSVFFGLGVAAFLLALSTLSPMKMTSVRMTGAPYFLSGETLRNQFQVRLINKRNESVNYVIYLDDQTLPGLELSGMKEVALPPMGESTGLVILTMPENDFKGPFKVRLHAKEERVDAGSAAHEVEFLGPDPRLKSNDYLNPENYLK